jgi:hypothetical protein
MTGGGVGGQGLRWACCGPDTRLCALTLDFALTTPPAQPDVGGKSIPVATGELSDLAGDEPLFKALYKWWVGTARLVRVRDGLTNWWGTRGASGGVRLTRRGGSLTLTSRCFKALYKWWV